MRILLSNVPPDKSAEIAKALVEEGLAACVNLFPIRSVYRWKGNLNVDEEVTLLVKVAKEKAEAAKARILQLHPYELPEVLALDVDREGSHEAYVRWVREQCGVVDV